ncbi:MAG: hypothetical protein Q8P12_03530, partial [bacterium]|nr:hypothetical protein [bacterium]
KPGAQEGNRVPESISPDGVAKNFCRPYRGWSEMFSLPHGSRRGLESCAPAGAFYILDSVPTACAVGLNLPPLRGGGTGWTKKRGDEPSSPKFISRKSSRQLLLFLLGGWFLLGSSFLGCFLHRSVLPFAFQISFRNELNSLHVVFNVYDLKK